MTNRTPKIVHLHASAAVGVREDLTSPVNQLRVVRKLSREWRFALSDRELSALMYIIDHTTLWGRPTYKFTYRSLADGTSVSPAGLGKARSKIQEVIKSLESAGAISIAPNRRDGLTITPNLEWKPALPASKLRLNRFMGPEYGAPECPKSGSGNARNRSLLSEEQIEQRDRGTGGEGSALAAGPISEEAPIPESKTPSVPVPSVRLRTRPVRIETEAAERAAPVQQNEVSEQGDLFHRGRKVVAAGSSVPATHQSAAVQAKHDARRTMRHAGALYGTWKAAYDEAGFGEVAACAEWSVKHKGMVVQQIAKLFTGTAPELHDYLDWIVGNWGTIRGEFSWMRRDGPPEVPQIDFVLRHKQAFTAAYGKRMVDRYLASLTPEQRDLRRDMIRNGLTEKEADLKLAERKAVSALRTEIEKGKAAAALTLRAAAVARANVNAERRELLRMQFRGQQPSVAERRPILADGARDMTDEQMAKNLSLVAKMMEVDPNAE